MTSSPKEDKKNILQRLLRGRIRAKAIKADFQEEKTPEHFSLFFESTLELSIIGMLLFTAAMFAPWLKEHLVLLFSILAIGFCLWKGVREAFLGWNRLLHLHRVIEEERWEIEHHRVHERHELETLYKAKGFSGTLLQDVVDTLMSDDNRLLQIMLEEEMGLVLESYEHPLKGGVFASLGVISAYILNILAFFFLPLWWCIFLPTFGLLIFASLTSYHYERLTLSSLLIWSTASLLFTILTVYFILELIL